MATLEVYDKSRGLKLMENIYQSLEARLSVSASTTCPVEFTSALVKMSAAQSCGKCTPCRVGLAQLGNLVDGILNGYGFEEDIDLIVELAENIYASSDCAIGYETAALVLKSVQGFKDDYLFHIQNNDCKADEFPAVPCVDGCPAHVDIPAYLALVAEGRYADAVRVVRKDNPFTVACGLVCEHPCELYCRRGMMDDPINIRGIKRFAADHNEGDKPPVKAEATNKKVAIIGGGPSGLSAAYYLACMGHSPVVFEQREQLGGMLRYGIPSYRLPREELDAEIAYLVSAGIEVKTGVSVGNDISLADLKTNYDAIYVAIGAHSDNKLGIAGEDAEGVFSAVELLRGIGDNQLPDFSGKNVVVVGGGNVAMDCARSSLRLGAKSVKIAYRRRKLDMTAQLAEIEAAIAEGCELLELQAPISISVEAGKVAGIVLQPQVIGEIVDGRAKPRNSADATKTVACDLILVAIGQSIDSADFEAAGFKTNRGRIVTEANGAITGLEATYSGGDCVTGPASAILAISAGKAAAANIDAQLGFDHEIKLDVDIPAALPRGKAYCARCNMEEVVYDNLTGNFDIVEIGLKNEEAVQEATRCLRCDHFGLGALRGGRSFSW